MYIYTVVGVMILICQYVNELFLPVMGNVDFWEVSYLTTHRCEPFSNTIADVKSFQYLFLISNESFFVFLLIAILHSVLSYACSSFYVENNGFEPLTPCVQGRCSSQLS